MGEAVPMGPEEIRIRLGVSRQRAYILIRRKDFPDPWVTLAMGQVWKSSDVERWVKTHRPELAGPDRPVL